MTRSDHLRLGWAFARSLARFRLAWAGAAVLRHLRGDQPLQPALQLLQHARSSIPSICRWQTIAAAVRQAEALGVVRLGLAGGEPLVRDDIGEIVAPRQGAGLLHLAQLQPQSLRSPVRIAVRRHRTRLHQPRRHRRASSRRARRQVAGRDHRGDPQPARAPHSRRRHLRRRHAQPRRRRLSARACRRSSTSACTSNRAARTPTSCAART